MIQTTQTINGSARAESPGLTLYPARSARPPAQRATFDPIEMRQRLNLLFKGKTYQQIARITGFHPETVRRYMTSTTCSAAFLHAVCTSTGTNVHWLLMGDGCMTIEDERHSWLIHADSRQLIESLAQRLAQVLNALEAPR